MLLPSPSWYLRQMEGHASLGFRYASILFYQTLQLQPKLRLFKHWRELRRDSTRAMSWLLPTLSLVWTCFRLSVLASGKIENLPQFFFLIHEANFYVTCNLVEKFCAGFVALAHDDGDDDWLVCSCQLNWMWNNG